MVILILFLYLNYPTSLANELNVEGTYYFITLSNFWTSHYPLFSFSRWAEDSSALAPLPSTTMDNDVGINNKSAREKQRIEIEKKRKKAAKKKERLAAMDAAGERQKKSWQSFNNKVIKKKKAGVVSSSILSPHLIIGIIKGSLWFYQKLTSWSLRIQEPANFDENPFWQILEGSSRIFIRNFNFPGHGLDGFTGELIHIWLVSRSEFVKYYFSTKCFVWMSLPSKTVKLIDICQ